MQVFAPLPPVEYFPLCFLLTILLSNYFPKYPSQKWDFGQLTSNRFFFFVHHEVDLCLYYKNMGWQSMMSDMPFCMVVTTLLYLSKGTYNLQCNYIVYFFSTQQTQMWPQIYIFWKSQLQRNYTTMSLVTKQAQMWPQIYFL